MNKKVLFITGSRGDIGKKIKEIFELNGYEIISPGSNDLDCSSKKSINLFFENFKVTKIDAFVHCAGINFPKEYNSITEDSFSRSININTMSFLYLTQELSSFFIDGESKIIAVSSIYGSISRIGRLEYSTSKHALIGMVKSLALELAVRKILVNSVSPGFIETSLTHKNNSPEVIADIKSKIPLNELGNTLSIAEFIYFLCSQKNTFMTGQDLIIDGGYLIGGFQK